MTCVLIIYCAVSSVLLHQMYTKCNITHCLLLWRLIQLPVYRIKVTLTCVDLQTHNLF